MPATQEKSATDNVSEARPAQQRPPQRPSGYKVIDVEGKNYEVIVPRDAKMVFLNELELPVEAPASQMLHLLNVAAHLFAGYADAATTIAVSHGSGGSVGGWGRDKDEDDREWARRCAQKANWLFKPMRRGRTR